MVFKLYTVSWTTAQATLKIFRGFSADMLHLLPNNDVCFGPQRPGSGKVLTSVVLFVERMR